MNWYENVKSLIKKHENDTMNLISIYSRVAELEKEIRNRLDEIAERTQKDWDHVRDGYSGNADDFQDR